MTPDQYRREGAEAMRAYIANDCDPAHLSRSDNPTEFHAGYRHAVIEKFTVIRAIDVDEVLAGTSVQKTHKTEIGTAAPDAVEAENERLRAMIRVNAIRYLNMSHEDIDAAIRAALSSTGEKG